MYSNMLMLSRPIFNFKDTAHENPEIGGGDVGMKELRHAQMF